MSELHLQVCGGFGNRLRALISGICWAEDLGRTLHVWWWSLDRACPCAFDKLLEVSSLPSWVTIHSGYLEQAVECLQSDEFVKAGYPTHIKSYGHFHSSDPERWLKYLRFLKPVASIAERVAQIPRQNAVGIHIRRGDNLKAAEESPLYRYIDEIWTHYRNASPFVIATDCPQAQYVLLCLLQDKCLFPARNMCRFSEQGIYEAVVDFFSLARCPVILGSAHSSFSDMAAAYGSSELKIIRKA
jgi:hypothetical protein